MCRINLGLVSIGSPEDLTSPKAGPVSVRRYMFRKNHQQSEEQAYAHRPQRHENLKTLFGSRTNLKQTLVGGGNADSSEMRCAMSKANLENHR